MSVDNDIQRAAALIGESKYVVAFTGAGHSTPSGIPDFRSPESGLWEQANPMLVASIWSFRLNPKTFYKWVQPLVKTMLDARPNPAHYALAELERRGMLKAVITQNIDGLQTAAGSLKVLEIHGHMRVATCIRCYKEVSVGEEFVELLLGGKVPHCRCGGVLKPNVILFGEQLPITVYNQALAEIKRCDLILVAGSSLEVAPASDLPYLATSRGARGIIVNFQPTGFDHVAEVVIHGDVAEVLPRIVEALQHGESHAQTVS